LSEAATNSPFAVGPLLRWLRPDDPQAAITIAQLTAATTIARPRRWVFAALVVSLALRNVVDFHSG
jgi:hypothetical protein